MEQEDLDTIIRNIEYHSERNLRETKRELERQFGQILLWCGVMVIVLIGIMLLIAGTI